MWRLYACQYRAPTAKTPFARDRFGVKTAPRKPKPKSTAGGVEPGCDQPRQFRLHTLTLKTEFSRLGLQVLGIRPVSGVEPVPPLD